MLKREHLHNPAGNVVLARCCCLLPSVLVRRWSSLCRRGPFEILLHIGEGLASQLIVIVIQRFIKGCKANGVAVEDRARGRRGGGGVLQRFETWHVRCAELHGSCNLAISRRRSCRYDFSLPMMTTMWSLWLERMRDPCG